MRRQANPLYNQVQADARARLRQMIADGCIIRDEDFRDTNYTMQGDSWIFGKMVDAGYSIGLDENYENIWWPKSYNDDDCGPPADPVAAAFEEV